MLASSTSLFSRLLIFRLIVVVNFYAVLWSDIAWSAGIITVPDGGRVLQEQRSAPTTPKSHEGLRINSDEPRETIKGGSKVKLVLLIFSGNTVFNDANLVEAAGKVLGKEFDLAGLQMIADRLGNYYRDHGYIFARAVLPPQTIDNGTVKIEIVEGRYGNIRAVGDSELEFAQKWLSTLGEGNVIHTAELERATLLLSDLPGILTQPVIRPGLKSGTGDLEVGVALPSKYDFNFGLDNHGSRYTGYYRAKGNVAINNPVTFGDQLLLGVVRSDDNLTLGNTVYSLPLGANGLRAQFSLAYTSYQIGKELSASQRSGTAVVGSTGITYSLKRSNALNLTLGANISRKNFTDIVGIESANKFTNSIPISLQFDWRDQLFSPSITFGSVVYTSGSLSDASLRTSSAVNREGVYKKINIDLIRQQQLPRDIFISLRLSLQSTRDNLDSSEDFVLGGPTGIRAYPTGEADGDRGWLSQIELQKKYGAFMPYFFYDYGRIDTNANRVGNITLVSKERSGIGAGLRYEAGRLRTDLILARRTTNILAESDSVHSSVQSWITANYWF